MIPAGLLVTVPLPVPDLVTVSVGFVIVNVRAPEVPPPGVGLNTLTSTVPAVAMSLAAMLARSSVLLTKVVVRSDPPQRTTEDATKLLPVTVRVNAAPPAVALLGERELSVGTGLLAPVPVTALVAPPPPVKVTLPVKVAAEVGLKRTVTV